MSYSALAKFYDLLMYDFNHKAIIDKVNYDFAGKEGIELCTGTATAAIILSTLGAKMTGVDISCEMLNVARQKAAKLAQRIEFINEDINSFFLINSMILFALCVMGLIIFNLRKSKTFLRKPITHLEKTEFCSLIYQQNTRHLMS